MPNIFQKIENIINTILFVGLIIIIIIISVIIFLPNTTDTTQDPSIATEIQTEKNKNHFNRANN